MPPVSLTAAIVHEFFMQLSSEQVESPGPLLPLMSPSLPADLHMFSQMSRISMSDDWAPLS